MPLADLPAAVLSRLHTTFTTTSRAETLCMMLGLGGLALALGVTVAQATLPPIFETEEELRRAVVETGFDASFCPDGWAADHAALLTLSEAEVTAWFLSESIRLSDADVIAAVGLYVTQAKDFRHIQGPALTRNQILLCIAESRRLVTPLHDRVPPELRGDLSLI